jgi:CheY-like chemotaxis protein
VVPQDVTRVFLNLFGNGFYAANKRRTGQAGGLPADAQGHDARLGETVEVRVRDNGTGIRRVRDKLFQPFFTTKPTGEGTGLGLSISYDIVTQQHGGTIEVESELGSSPNSPCACRAAGAFSGESVMSVSILVVDDEADVAELFRQQFRREVRQGQYVIHFAQSAEEALDQLDSGIRPELIVILSDINMPAWTARPAAQDQGAARRPAGDHGDGLRRRRAAPQGERVRRPEFVTKPVDFDLLKQQLQQLRRAMSEPAKILAVDDEPDFELLLQQRFRSASARALRLPLRPARRGGAGGAGAEEPDIGLLLLDINMPVMDGLTLLRSCARASRRPAR